MRKRLSWDEEKVAELEKKADPYTMNQTHENPPVQKYQTGSPSAWGEDPNMATPWKTEGRTETGHPAPASKAAHEAVLAARKLEDKAIKCITIAQRMLPNANDEIIEAQATDLMYLPERSVLATLQRQAELAQILSGKKCDTEEGADVEAKKAPKAPKMDDGGSAEEEMTGADVEAKKAPKMDDEGADVEAKKAPKMDEEGADVEAKKAPKMDEEGADVEAKKAPKMDDEGADVEAKKAPKMDEAPDGKEAGDLLDQIFAQEVTASEKTGAKKLSGLVKQASESDSLAGLWDTAPDVSKIFR